MFVSDIYYDYPRAKAFEIVGQLNEPDMFYEFNTLAVFRHKPTGIMWYAISSGCSCPIPFEEYYVNYENLESDMDEINHRTFKTFKKEVMAFCAKGDRYHSTIPLDERKALVEKVRGLLK